MGFATRAYLGYSPGSRRGKTKKGEKNEHNQQQPKKEKDRGRGARGKEKQGLFRRARFADTLCKVAHRSIKHAVKETLVQSSQR